MKLHFIALGLLASGMQTGCASFSRHDNWLSPNHPMDVWSETELEDHIKTHLTTIAGLEAEYYAATSADVKKAKRDQIADLMLGDINEFWRRFITAFYGRIGASKTLIEGTALGLTGAAGITTPALSAKVLATSAAAILGMGGAFEKNVLQSNAADVLVGQMEADRKQFSGGIQKKLSQTAAAYSLVQLNSDIAEYATTMSVPYALMSIRGKTGQQAEKAQTDRFN